MAPAQKRLAADLAQVPFRDAAVPVVNNADARAVQTADECRDGLVRQVSAPVRWQESVERLAREGATTFVEVGQGTVLSGLVRRIARAPIEIVVSALGKEAPLWGSLLLAAREARRRRSEVRPRHRRGHLPLDLL